MWGFKSRRTFASANEERTTSRRWSGLNALNLKVLWHNSIDRNCSTRENKYEPSFWNRNEFFSVSAIIISLYRIILQIIRSEDIFTRFLGAKAEPSLLGLCWVTTEALRVFSGKIFLQWRVWSWLRMNASYRLNTCKSRGSMKSACWLWWRPAHGCVTRIQSARYSGIAFRKKD